MKWDVQIHGKASARAFEISVINTERVGSAQRQYGWFDENKLLVSHNGGPCSWPVTERVWVRLVAVAHEVAAELNAQP